MTQTIDAICENGTLRPLQPGVIVDFEGQRVRVTIESQHEPDVLRLAQAVYEGLSEEEIDEIDRIAMDRSRFFGNRSAD